MTIHQIVPFTADLARAMVFIDGENLAIRYANLLKTRNETQRAEIRYQQDTFVWSTELLGSGGGTPAIMRKYYYTCVQGDQPALEDVAKRLKELGMEAPRVFRKEKGRRAKRVDITLATDMLLHAVRKHYDVAVLVAGDEDYVPLVHAVQREGARVYVAFVPDGLSPALEMAADLYVDLQRYFFNS